jgi:hypothetical protein
MNATSGNVPQTGSFNLRGLLRAPVLSPIDFFAGVREALRDGLPPGLRDFQLGRGWSRLVKIHYGRPDLHFEMWHHMGAGRLEIGLHFEGTRALNDAAFDYFRARMVEVKARLPKAELEPWDKGWSRLYETLPAAQLDEDVRRKTIEVATTYITVLKPMLDRFLEE